MEKFYAVSYGLILLAVSGLTASSASATDFDSLQQAIYRGEADIETLESEHGRYAGFLMEPLQQLASIQLEANRFDDAERTVDRAIQIARFNNGLYSRAQYPLLQLEIEISRSRGDWEGTSAQLQHFVWLVAHRFEGDRISQLHTLNWLANKNLQCALESSAAHRAAYLIEATTINEYAVQLAQATRNTGSPVYADLLYSLTQKYYAETRGILADHDSSYKLRTLSPIHPALENTIESKTTALERRHAAGLDKLVMLRNPITSSGTPAEEALGMIELYIADWQLAFNNPDDVAAHYRNALALLRAAGIADSRLERFFAHPVTIPRPRFTLSFAEALTELENATAASAPETDGLAWQLTLQEASSSLPGVVAELALQDADIRPDNNWNHVNLTLEFDPGKNSRFRLRGYSLGSMAIASAIRVADSALASERDLQSVLTRIKSLPFRPALVDGVAVPATLAVTYVYQDHADAPTPRLLTLR